MYLALTKELAISRITISPHITLLFVTKLGQYITNKNYGGIALMIF